MAEANIKIAATTEVVLVPMLIRPGDRVLIPLIPGMTHQWVHEAKLNLKAQFPGVDFRFLEGATMQHALIYRPEDEVEISPTGRTAKQALRRNP